MINIWKLFKGEVTRLVLYKVIFFGLLVSLLWIVIIVLFSTDEVKSSLPLIIVTDSGLMSIILLGAMFYFEKQEGIPQTLLVTPIKVSQILIAKVAASIFTCLISIVIIFVATLIFHGIVINLLLSTFYVIVAVTAHTALGYLIILASKDFMSMLIKFMGLVMVLIAPSLLLLLNVIPSDLSFIAIISPTYATELLMNSLFQTTDLWQVLLSISWIGAIGGFLYPFVIKKQYQHYALGN